MILEGLGVLSLKGVMAAGCAVGVWRTWRSFPENEAKARLMRCFVLGDICLKRKNRKGKEVKRYPSIEGIEIEDDRLNIHFVLPVGVDPKEVHNHMWLFKQQFGSEIKMTGDSRAFTLTTFQSNLKPFKYNVSEFDVSDMLVPIVAGKTRDRMFIYDMVEHPHLLIAGETGSGKSTQLRAILTALIQTQSPDELHLYLADLKRSEFHIFKDVGHVKNNVIDRDKLESMLLDIKHLMKERGDLLNKEGEAHISDLPKSKRPPFIVLCIDEVALIKKDEALMDMIEEVAQIGRALGVFLILSMQRPDAKVLDGKIKQCLTVRMAFRQADAINSGIVLGQGGAELIGLKERGLMLLKHETLERVQGPYLELKKAKEILAQYKVEKPQEEQIQVDDGDSIGGLDG